MSIKTSPGRTASRDGDNGFMVVGNTIIQWGVHVIGATTIRTAIAGTLTNALVTDARYTIVSVGTPITTGIDVLNLVQDVKYVITTAGDTDFTALGAEDSVVGTEFVYNGDETQDATSGIVSEVFVVDTDFTLVGAPNNNIGTVFTATGTTTGSGTANEIQETTHPLAFHTPLSGAPYFVSLQATESGNTDGIDSVTFDSSSLTSTGVGINFEAGTRSTGDEVRYMVIGKIISNY